MCKPGDALFIIAKSGDNYRAVFQGEQIEVPMSSVEAVAERGAAAVDDDDDDGDDGDGDDDGDDDDDDAGGFGGFDEVDEEKAAADQVSAVTVVHAIFKGLPSDLREGV